MRTDLRATLVVATLIISSLAASSCGSTGKPSGAAPRPSASASSSAGPAVAVRRDAWALASEGERLWAEGKDDAATVVALDAGRAFVATGAELAPAVAYATGIPQRVGSTLVAPICLASLAPDAPRPPPGDFTRSMDTSSCALVEATVHPGDPAGGRPARFDVGRILFEAEAEVYVAAEEAWPALVYAKDKAWLFRSPDVHVELPYGAEEAWIGASGRAALLGHGALRIVDTATGNELSTIAYAAFPLGRFVSGGARLVLLAERALVIDAAAARVLLDESDVVGSAYDDALGALLVVRAASSGLTLSSIFVDGTPTKTTPLKGKKDGRYVRVRVDGASRAVQVSQESFGEPIGDLGRFSLPGLEPLPALPPSEPPPVPIEQVVDVAPYRALASAGHVIPPSGGDGTRFYYDLTAARSADGATLALLERSTQPYELPDWNLVLVDPRSLEVKHRTVLSPRELPHFGGRALVAFTDPRTLVVVVNQTVFAVDATTGEVTRRSEVDPNLGPPVVLAPGVVGFADRKVRGLALFDTRMSGDEAGAPWRVPSRASPPFEYLRDAAPTAEVLGQWQTTDVRYVLRADLDVRANDVAIGDADVPDWMLCRVRGAGRDELYPLAVCAGAARARPLGSANPTPTLSNRRR